jgi:hypothetical protein
MVLDKTSRSVYPPETAWHSYHCLSIGAWGMSPSLKELSRLFNSCVRFSQIASEYDILHFRFGNVILGLKLFQSILPYVVCPKILIPFLASLVHIFANGRPRWSNLVHIAERFQRALFYIDVRRNALPHYSEREWRDREERANLGTSRLFIELSAEGWNPTNRRVCGSISCVNGNCACGLRSASHLRDSSDAYWGLVIGGRQPCLHEDKDQQQWAENQLMKAPITFGPHEEFLSAPSLLTHPHLSPTSTLLSRSLHLRICTHESLGPRWEVQAFEAEDAKTPTPPSLQNARNRGATSPKEI